MSYDPGRLNRAQKLWSSCRALRPEIWYVPMLSLGVYDRMNCGITRPVLMSRYSRSFPSCCSFGAGTVRRSKSCPPTSAATEMELAGFGATLALSWACTVVGRASAIAPAARSMAAPHEMSFMVSLLVGSMLPVEVPAAGMIRAMDVDVAGGALAVEHELHVGRECPAAWRDPVPAADVALLAEPRASDLEHFLVRRAVHVVAVRAVLGHRRVLPQVGPALLGVAGEAGLVHRRRHQELLVGGAVRVVAGGALHLPLRDRHVRVVRLLGDLSRVAAL